MTYNVTLPHDELTLHLIASGLVILANQAEEGKPLTLPYPRSLERGLNTLMVTCLRKKIPHPQSIPDLFDWCRRPLIQWPLDLPPDSFSPHDTLLNSGYPTDFCEHWSYPSSDIVAELNEQHFFRTFLNICKNMNKPDVYIAFRRLLIERPVLTEFELLELSLDPSVELLTDQLKSAYKQAPIAHTNKGYFRCCSDCHNLLLKNNQGILVCENTRCRSKSTSERIIHQNESVLWLRREIRHFITMPGKAELRLFNDITKLGVKVDLWPDFDKYDLRLTFPDGKVWAVDVKDWANPFLLARSVKAIPTDSSWTQGYFVIPKERCQHHSGQSDYIRAFRNNCRILDKRTDVVDERKFLTLVKQKLKQVNHA